MRNQIHWLPLIACVLAVLALLVARGNVPDEEAFEAFQAARSLASGQGGVAVVGAPLFVLLLGGLGRAGLDILQMGLLLSVVGWLAAIAAVYAIGVRLNQWVMAIFAAGALAIEPTFYGLVGRDTLFVMGLLWGALADFKFQITDYRLQTTDCRFCVPRFVVSVFVLIALAASTLYHIRLASWSALGASYGPALLPGLALLAGWVLQRLVALVGYYPLAQADRRVLVASALALALLGFGYARGADRLLGGATSQAAAGRLALWAQAGQWLSQNTQPEAAVWSDALGALGYFSGRPIVSAITQTAPPEYCVTLNSLAWAERTSQPWFQEHYRRVFGLANPYDSIAPVTIWHYWPSPFDMGDAVDVGARFGRAPGERVELVNYRLDSTQLIPGENQHLTLTWRAPELLKHGLGVRVRLYDPATKRVWAQVDRPAPAGISSLLWAAGRLMTDRYTLFIPGDLPPSKYVLDVRVYADSVEHFLSPSSADNGGEEGDEVLTLAHLEAQPWTSSSPMATAWPTAVSLGDAIELTGYSVNPAPWRGQAGGVYTLVERGGTLRVRLYWHALATPGESYHVFTHLVAPDGHIAAQSDSAPVYETVPTTLWQAGQYILDEHIMMIDPALPPGRYWLKVGMYLPDSGERLVMLDAAGQPVPDNSLLLLPVDVE